MAWIDVNVKGIILLLDIECNGIGGWIQTYTRMYTHICTPGFIYACFLLSN